MSCYHRASTLAGRLFIKSWTYSENTEEKKTVGEWDNVRGK